MEGTINGMQFSHDSHYQLGDIANGHVLTKDGWLPIGAAYLSASAADQKARSIATYERISGIAWILIGILQLALLITFIAGIWNIIAGISRLRLAPAIERRHHSVPQAFAGWGMLVAIGLVNLLFGAVFGVVMVAVDFAIRQVVLDNRGIFTSHDPTEQSAVSASPHRTPYQPAPGAPTETGQGW